MGLKKLIYEKANKEAQTILTKAKEEKEALLKELNEKTDKKAENLLTNALRKDAKTISEKKLEFEHEKKRIILQEKNTQIERVLAMFEERLLNLNDRELFDYTVKLIKEQKIQGNEVVRVKKADYNRYLKLFSSETKKRDLVVLDLLNNKLGKNYNLKLDKTVAPIKDGFVLVGEFYDLNFSLEPQIERIRREYEREIHKILYE